MPLRCETRRHYPKKNYNLFDFSYFRIRCETRAVLDRNIPIILHIHVNSFFLSVRCETRGQPLTKNTE